MYCRLTGHVVFNSHLLAKKGRLVDVPQEMARFFRINGEAGRSWCGRLKMVFRRRNVGLWPETCPLTRRTAGHVSDSGRNVVSLTLVTWSQVGAQREDGSFG
jgi:hypothetical protein